MPPIEPIVVAPLSRVPHVTDGSESVTFPNCDTEMYKKLGRLIYEASKSDAGLQTLKAQVASTLTNSANAAAMATIKFNLIRDTPQVVNIVIPELKDEHRDFPKGGFDDYLIQIGLVTVRACKR